MNFPDLSANSESMLFSNDKVIISVDRRNGKKCITSVIGMAEDLDLSKILSYLKKKHNCNGSLCKNKKNDKVMLFTGDQKENIYNFLINEEIYKKEDIIIKGI
jgi:translation initiation factor 1